MYLSPSSKLIVALSALSSILACEDDCIAGITQVYLGNYSTPINSVLSQISTQIANKFLPPDQQPSDPTTLIQPILSAYNNISYDSLENAVFPSYFHGKCQRFDPNGQDPPGCPNPDCPVVCGTSGSLVHFYTTLRFIVFNDTRAVLQEVSQPGTDAFVQIQDMINHANANAKRSLNIHGHRRYTRSRILSSLSPDLDRSHSTSGTMSGISPSSANSTSVFPSAKIPSLRKEASDSDDLASVLSQIGDLLATACGGTPEDSTNGLPGCSWEVAMKAYFLTFP